MNRLAQRPRFGVASQTTQPLDKVRRLVELIQKRFPLSEVRFVDTICQPTKQRQAAAVDLARQSDVVVVVGGSHSNNTRELAATCRRHCARVHHVQGCVQSVFHPWLKVFMEFIYAVICIASEAK